MDTVIRSAILFVCLAGGLSACAGARFTDSGYGVSDYGYIAVDAQKRKFVYDQLANRGEYAEGMYSFVSRDSIALDARFDPLAILYQRFHNAAALNHINANLPYRSAIRCPEPHRCRVVVYAPPDLYPSARHDSLSTALFDTVGDETVLTYIYYEDWYRIAIRDTVRVTETVRQSEYK